MGAGVSAGECNDDLVDNLMEADYIKSAEVERVFRAVDRGAYFIPDATVNVNAYRDVAWKNGHFHISAPCIYSEVMEGLKLKPGLSFLNLGSGTGYLSTMAGLILGSYGVNHGIELHEDVIIYANKKVEEFKKYSGALDEYDFCEPKFMQGNCLSLASGGHLYDRVYCGAACPEQYLNYMKTLIKPGGILIVPLNDQLLEMTRVSERSWNTRSLLPVSFATLISPAEGNQEMIRLFDIQPLTLQELCRASIRNILRKLVAAENPDVQKITKNHPKKKKRGSKRGRRSKKKGQKPATEELFDYLMQTVAHQKSVFQSAMRHRLQYDRNLALQAQGLPPEPLEPIQADQRCSLRFRRAQSNDSGSASGSGSDSESDASDDPFAEPISKMHDVFLEIIGNLGGGESSSSSENANVAQDQASTSVAEEGQGSNSMTVEAIVERSCDGADNEERASTDEKTERMVAEDGKRKEEAICGSSSAPEAKRRNNRHKFDSGLGDELISEISGPDNIVETVNNNSSDDEARFKENDIESITEYKNKKFKTDSSEESGDEFDPVKEIKKKMYKSPYSPHMKDKIEQLPLPSILKRYLHFYREF